MSSSPYTHVLQLLRLLYYLANSNKKKETKTYTKFHLSCLIAKFLLLQMRLPGETGQSLHQSSWPVQGTCNKGHFYGVLCETFVHGANWLVILQTKNGVKNGLADIPTPTIVR